LINQNVGLLCETDSPNVISTWPEVNELEGFFCVVSFRGQREKDIPKSAAIHVSVFALNPKDQSNQKNTLYKERLLSFDITFISKIKVESYYKNGVYLYANDRTATVKIFSNTPFTSYTENRNE